jgi:hypothetical protein
MAALATRYRRGDRVSRLQMRWLLAALAIAIAGFAGVVVELTVRTDDGLNISAFVAYARILAMPIAIGIAVTRYRLYEIDRIISRTLSYGLVTVTLALMFVGLVLGLQAVLVAAYLYVYMWVTPHDELALLRANNPAAALALGLSMIGFALPMTSSIGHSDGIVDMTISWCPDHLARHADDVVAGQLCLAAPAGWRDDHRH